MKLSLKHFVLTSIATLLLGGCKRLDTIPYTPAITPDQFLKNAPWVRVDIGTLHFILSQPTSTVIVYFVGLLAIYGGYKFLSNTNDSRAKLYWGIGLCLTGLGALSAGTSYQVLGYELKCAGREICTWTSWFEVIYLLLTVPGMSAFVIAAAYSSTQGKVRKGIISYAVIYGLVYCALLLYGAFAPVGFLVSFDFFTLVSLPSLLILMWICTTAYIYDKSEKNLSLRNSWLIFVAVGLYYYSYMLMGFTQRLWQHGIWFSENDVLHTGMICWVYYIIRRLPGAVSDLQE